MSKLLIMCEGPNELEVVKMLLEHGKFYFSSDDLLIQFLITQGKFLIMLL